MSKKIISAVLTLVLLIGLVPAAAIPAFAAASGKCGASLAFQVTSDTLTITGTGKMTDYDASGSNVAPWADQASTVKKVVFPKGMTTVGTNAFNGFSVLEEVTFAGLVGVNADAFKGCTKLKTVHVSDQGTWQNIKSQMITTGNNALRNAAPVYEIPDTPAFKNERLVNFVAAQVTFHNKAYKVGEVYKIGYGTPAKDEKQIIDKKDAKHVLDDYLDAIRMKISAELSAVTGSKLDALVAFSFHNGLEWLKGGRLYTAVTTPKSESEVLDAFLKSGNYWDAQQLNDRLCEANLYYNGIYSNTAPANYAYTSLQSNAKDVPSDIMGYLITETVKISYTPSYLNHEFLGWYTAKVGGSLVNTLDHTTHKSVLYAHWQEKGQGVVDGKITGTPVSYRIPASLADLNKAENKDSKGRIKVFSAPDYKTLIDTVTPESIMDVEAEYRDPTTKRLWVRLRSSGWVDLGTTSIAIEAGVVELKPRQRLEIWEDNSGTRSTTKKVGGGLRNGDRVSVSKRDGDWGLTVYLDGDTGSYKYGWINLNHVKMDGTTNGGGKDYSDSPTGKPPIGTGTVIETDNLHVRSKPDVYGEHYCNLRKGEKVNIYDKTTTNHVVWALLDQGWASMQYIQEDKPEEAEKPFNPSDFVDDGNTKVLATGKAFSNIQLNVRSGPSANYRKVTTLANGAKMSIYQTRTYNGSQWGRMEKGWVCLNYVRLDNGVVLPDNSSSPESEGLGQGRISDCSTHANIRQNATTQSALLGTYPLGAVVDLLDKADNGGTTWYHTPRGWVCGKYVTPIVGSKVPGASNPSVKPNIPAGTTGIVSASMDVNVRKQPGLKFDKVTALKSGSRVNIYGSETVNGHVWYKIDQGWMSGDYIILNGVNSDGNIAGIEGSAGTTEVSKGKFATGTIAQAGTRVYNGPGYGYQTKKTLALGTAVTVYEQRLAGGVAWGRISNTEWVNLAFVTLNGTGVTGTGTMGTIVRANHAVNVRSIPSTNGAQMATLLVGSPVEVLETKDVGNETWGRTPQGWVNMMYISLSGALPTPPLQVPDSNNPAQPKPGKPSNQGIPFDMDGVMNQDADLLMIPGNLGDYDAQIFKGQNVKVSKLEKVDGKLWGLVEGGWISMDQVNLGTFMVSETAQIIWKDTSKTLASGALNKGEMKQIIELHMDDAKKVWGRIGTDQWIELTSITKPEQYKKTFLVKATAAIDLVVRAEPKAEADQVGSTLASGASIDVIGLEYDVDGNVWCRIQNSSISGWAPMNQISVNSTGRVTSETQLVWADRDMVTASGVLNQGETYRVTQLILNSKGVVMGSQDGSTWIEISGLTVVS